MKRIAAGVMMVGLLCGCITIGEQVASTGGRLDSCMGECVETSVYQVGEYEVVFEVVALIAGDNGPAEITVLIDGEVEGVIESYFDYDLWSDQPAAYLSWEMVDGDWRRDLVIETTSGERYVIGSVNGRLVKLD